MDPKLLTESGWKAVAAKFKIKDNGLQKALVLYEIMGDDEPDDGLRALASICRLAAALEKAKDVTASPPALKYVKDVQVAAEAAQRDINKEKALADKAKVLDAKAKAAQAQADAVEAKADADAKKREMQEKKSARDQDEEKEDEGEEEEGDYRQMLLAAFQKLKGAKDISFEFIVCDAKPHCCVMIAKRITAKHKAELTRVSGGSKRFLHVGTCRVEDGKINFNTEKPAAGLARKLQESIKHYTGKKLPVVVGAESADEGDGEPGSEQPPGRPDAAKGNKASEKEPPSNATDPDRQRPASGNGGGGEAGAGEAGAKSPEKEAPPNMTAPVSLSGSVGRGGKNKPEDVQAVQGALNRRAKAGLEVDGKCGTQTIKAIMAFQKTLGFAAPDGLIEPGKKTERALNGDTSGPAPGEKPGTGGGADAGKGEKKGPGGAGVGDGGRKGAGGVVGGVIEAALKAAKEAAERKANMERMVKEAIDKLKKAAEGAAGSEGKRIKEELEKTYKETLEHIKKIEVAARELVNRKTDEAARALKKLVEESVPGFKAVENQTANALKWLGEAGSGIIDGAKELAKKVTKEVAEKKNQADQAYKDAMAKLKQAAEDEAGEEGKKIKEELEKAYKENQEHIRKVAEAAVQLAKRETEEAAETLRKAAEKTVPGFQTVEDLTKKAADWFSS